MATTYTKIVKPVSAKVARFSIAKFGQAKFGKTDAFSKTAKPTNTFTKIVKP